MARPQTHETEALTDLHHSIRKQQQRVMRQIATKQIQVARLLTECDELRAELCDIAEQQAIAWACQGQNRQEGAA